MAIEVISSELAFSRARGNKYSKYPSPESQSERLFPFPRPHCEPTFEISPDAKIFTMGSCFAREVDKALRKVGFEVISRTSELAESSIRDGNDESLYNKYTIHSIFNEIKWALDPSTPYPGAQALLEVSSNSWTDPQLGGNTFTGTLEEMLGFRKAYCESMKRISDADVIIITLGLVEAWYDKNSNLYLNGAPPVRLAKKQPERFELKVLDYNEIIIALEEIYSLVTKHGKKTAKFLVTVSPVPLLATFRNQDILVANTYSKAVQRAAIEKFVLDHDNVNYFPSYEFVSLFNSKNNWAGDYRHVNPAVVNRIMSSVMVRYAPTSATAVAVLSSDINLLYKSGHFQEVCKIGVEVDLKILPISSLYKVGLSYKKMDRLSEALDIFSMCAELDANFRGALENSISMAFKLKDFNKFKDLLLVHEKKFPDSGDFRLKFVKNKSAIS